VFTVGSDDPANKAPKDYIAYLFASVPGICDIGTYTGKGGTEFVDCGFTNGARFVLVKRTDGSGNWIYCDALRGMAYGNAPALALNTTEAQKSGSFILSFPGGFQASNPSSGYPSLAPYDPNINGAEYIYMAIA
jgi:hypothetical protein